MENKRKIGSVYEEKAWEYLQSKGCILVEKNYRCKIGEIDLIYYDGPYLVYGEVKYRKNEKTGGSLEAVNERKQKVISKVAAYYMLTHQTSDDLPCRFDVIGITGESIQWIKDAFEYGQ